MVFSSILFLFLFLPLALAAYYTCHGLGLHRTKNLLLTLFSFVFYGWANPIFIVLMLISTLIDYVAGLLLTGHYRASAWSQPVPLLEKG